MENRPNIEESHRFEPCTAHQLSEPILANAPVAQGDLLPPPVASQEFRPLSSPTTPTGPTVKRHRSNQGYGTPWELIRACETKFRLRCAWDLAANESNTKADRFYDEAMNSLVQPWHQISAPGGFLWLNPPFDNIAPWAEKCATETATKRCAPILFLTPASVGANWFRDHVHGKARVLGLNGRIQFVGASDPYPKDCIISVFDHFGPTGFDVWTWPKELAKPSSPLSSKSVPPTSTPDP